MDEDDDIRIVPFTEEEKARLNEKVRKMKFARPPPKLPSTKRPGTTSSLKTTPQTFFDIAEEKPLSDRKASDDSGISSCDSEKGATPVYHHSPTEPFHYIQEFQYSQYVCDGHDWIPEESDSIADSSNIYSDSVMECSDIYSDSVATLPTAQYSRNTRIFDETVLEEKDSELEEQIFTEQDTSCHQAEAVVMEEEADSSYPKELHNVDERSFDTSWSFSSISGVHPVESIDATSPVVYSKKLEMALRKDRGGLLEVTQRVNGKYGRFEEPTYGPLLLTTSVPVTSLKDIMESSLTSLTSFLRSGRIIPKETEKKEENAEPENSSGTTTKREEEISVGKQSMGALTVPSPKKKSRRRLKVKRKSHRSGESSGPTSLPDEKPEGSVKIKDGEQRKRTMSVVSTTSDSSKQSIKIVIRRDIPCKIAKTPSVACEKKATSLRRSAESSSESVQDRDERSSVPSPSKKPRLPVRVKLALPRARSISSPPTLAKAPQDRAKSTSATQTSTPLIERSKSRAEEGSDDKVRTDSRIQTSAAPVSPVPTTSLLRTSAVKKFHYWNKPTFEEDALAAKLSKLMGFEVSTSNPLWFHELQKKASEYIRMLDAENNNVRELMRDLDYFRKNRENELSRCKRLLAESEDLAAISRRNRSPTNASPAQDLRIPCIFSRVTNGRLPAFDDRVHQRSCSFQTSHEDIATCDMVSTRAPEIDVTTRMTTATCLPPCISPPAKSRKSLERIVERLKSPHEDIPRDPAPSSVELVRLPYVEYTRPASQFHREIPSPAHVIHCRNPPGARGFWNSTIANNNGVRYERTCGVEAARNSVAAGFPS
uniref:Adenomatous polyposis coli protein n=1 Tax=Haemonchus contortus TaxID=6289 RepID=A0A7I4YDK4_HAECO